MMRDNTWWLLQRLASAYPDGLSLWKVGGPAKRLHKHGMLEPLTLHGDQVWSWRLSPKGFAQIPLEIRERERHGRGF